MATNRRSNPSLPDNSSGAPLQPRVRRRRDYERMNTFNADQIERRTGPTWAAELDRETTFKNVMKSKPWRKPKPKTQDKDDPFKPSTTETPPKDEDMYVGDCTGSIPVKKTLAQNFDYAGFSVLLRTVYDTTTTLENRLPQICPFPIFQHAMTEVLMARILSIQQQEMRHPDLVTLQDALTAIRCKSTIIPKPIFDYINNIGKNATPNGDKIWINHPKIAIPLGPHLGVDSGTFGKPTAVNHNVYECYWSPFVTKQYILKTLQFNEGHTDNAYWNPFPNDWLPPGSRCNENLLGWRPLENMHRNAIQKLQQCEFDNDESLAGRLCHCPYAMELVTGTWSRIHNVKTVPADFESKENSAAFIYKEFDPSEEDQSAILYDMASNLICPFSFGGSAANKSNYYAYKRKRSDKSAGCFALIDDSPIVNWVSNRNNNFEMREDFVSRNTYHDRQSLREGNFMEVVSNGHTYDDLMSWLRRVFIENKTIPKT